MPNLKRAISVCLHKNYTKNDTIKNVKQCFKHYIHVLLYTVTYKQLLSQFMHINNNIILTFVFKNYVKLILIFVFIIYVQKSNYCIRFYQLSWDKQKYFKT